MKDLSPSVFFFCIMLMGNIRKTCKFMKTHFTEVLLTYKKLYIFKVYNLMSLGIRIHL